MIFRAVIGEEPLFSLSKGKFHKVENAKERGAFVVSINGMQLFGLDFPKIETRRPARALGRNL
jgi:hypothetical protein